jgi:tetratricopeptide (TPR) repeat protein
MELAPDGFLVEEGLDQRYDVLKELGDCHTSLGNWDRARQCYEEAALLAPGRPDPLVGRGVVGLQAGALDEADRAFDDALRVDPACAEAWAGLAMVAEARADYAASVDLYLRCLENAPDNLVALLGLFQASVRLGSFATIVHYLSVYLERHPDDVAVLYCLATLHARDGRRSEARAALGRILRLAPAHPEAAALLAELDGRPTGASAA